MTELLNRAIETVTGWLPWLNETVTPFVAIWI